MRKLVTPLLPTKLELIWDILRSYTNACHWDTTSDKDSPERNLRREEGFLDSNIQSTERLVTLCFK